MENATEDERLLRSTISSLRKFVDKKKFYEAYKLYMKIHSRFSSQKKHDELLSLIFQGATLLLNLKQDSPGVDLSFTYLKTVIKYKMKPNRVHLQKLSRLFAKMNDSAEARKFINQTIKWSKNESDEVLIGHPLMHKYLGDIYWERDNYVYAHHHYIHSFDGSSLAIMLIDLSVHASFEEEIDLFIVHVVLQYLCLEKVDIANEAFTCYTREHPDIKAHGPPYMWPLLNFTCFLLQIIDSKQLTTFRILCEIYKPCIQRDPLYPQYLEIIQKVFFSVKPNHRGQRFLGRIFQVMATDIMIEGEIVL